jgi:hypothetical protein
MNCGVSDLWLWEAIQGRLKGRKNDYVAKGWGKGWLKGLEKGARG